jgi:putative tricarboxylic transport membrane protein
MRIAVLTLAVAGSVLSALYLLEGTRYSMGTLAEPGPGLFPLMVSGILLLGFVGTGIEALASASKAKAGWPAGPARWRVAAIALSCAAYGLALPYLGHWIAGSLLALAVLHVMALRSWPVKVVLSLGIGVGSYVLFGVVLGVPFPAGKLFG